MDWGSIMDAVQGIPVVGDVTTVLGTVAGVLGVSLPFLRKSATHKTGVAIGKLAKTVFRQKLKAARDAADRADRITDTLDDFVDGIKEGLQ